MHADGIDNEDTWKIVGIGPERYRRRHYAISNICSFHLTFGRFGEIIVYYICSRIPIYISRELDTSRKCNAL